MTVAISCSKATTGTIDAPNEHPSGQSFTVIVESVRELFTGGEGVHPTMTTRRPISSVTPTQIFDKLSLLIVEYRSPAKVVYKTTIDNWSNPNNKASIPWSEEEGQGRYAAIRLTGDECLDEGVTYMAYAIYDEARMVMPAKGPLAFTDQNMYYFASADFNQNNTQVEILLQRIVTRHEFLREFVDANAALSQLVDNIAKDIREKQLTTEVVGGLLHSALLDPVTDALGLGGLLFATQVVDALVGALTGDLIEALNKVLLQELLTRLESTLKANDADADLLGLQNLLNPWAISSSADVTGYFTPSLNFDLQPIAASSQAAVTWEGILMQRTAGEELSSERYISMILLGGDNLIDKIDVKKEGLVGPLVDGVVDDPVLYGRLININNDLTYTAAPNVAYHTNYALLNLTLDNYGTSEDSEQLHLTAKLDSALVTRELLTNLLGDLLGGLLGSLLTPLLNAVTNVLDTTTFALDVKLPDLSIQNIVVEGGWEPTTSSLENGN